MSSLVGESPSNTTNSTFIQSFLRRSNEIFTAILSSFCFGQAISVFLISLRWETVYLYKSLRDETFNPKTDFLRLNKSLKANGHCEKQGATSGYRLEASASSSRHLVQERPRHLNDYCVRRFIQSQAAYQVFPCHLNSHVQRQLCRPGDSFHCHQRADIFPLLCQRSVEQNLPTFSFYFFKFYFFVSHCCPYSSYFFYFSLACLLLTIPTV